ncbi:chloride channel protein [Anaerocolumna sp. AGMB13025]|uniref:chloride channel protein n=1 Tax=Anaerocolumna sp. AGMB13025 TaxID=3039116 RepID=UPI00241C732F|nr:chloride channel protein [Anaerocolumna sp. AGMB13025]WFR58454.1 chloride channel protein [Anaerocolumna sp. AGMB13025]
MLKRIYANYKDIVLLGLLGVMIGLTVGAIDALFGRVLLTITAFREQNVYKLLPFLPIIGVFITYVYTRYGKDIIKGMNLIFSAGFNKEETIPKRLIPFIMVSTWLTHLFGGSAGREGVAVQIGGTFAHNLGKHMKLEDHHKILVVTGMAAGFSGLFQTPLAAVFFAMEVMVAGALEYSALFPCVIAAFTASYTSHYLGLEKFSVNLSDKTGPLEVSFSFLIKVIMIGVLFGVTGGLFAHTLAKVKAFLNKLFKNPILKIFIIGCLLSISLMFIHHGRYSGLGTNLIGGVFGGDTIYPYDWILKFIFTILTLAAGFQGGEVTPLFAIGSGLGAFLGSLLGLPTALAAALGYTAVFGSATNTMLAPIFIGVEVFGFSYLPYFFVVTAFAYVFNGNKTIYAAQKSMY